MIAFKKRSLSLVFVAVLPLAMLGCSEDFADNPKPNQPPETHISIFSERELNPTISRQTLSWWGDDPDGVVVGFIYTFDNNAPDLQEWDSAAPSPQWTFTTNTQETFTLTLSGNDTVYTLHVKAIDDAGAADPTAAVQSFPIINSRPSVEFPVGVDVPETTFTVASFTWTGADLDGNDTIEKYQWVLDDTTDESKWSDIEADRTSLTLTSNQGLSEGQHVFYLRVVDIAGARSNIIRMPREANDIWYVREPRSSFLIIDDYNVNDNTDSFYRSTLTNIVGPVDVWDIKSRSGALNPPSPQTFTLTMLLFDRVFWYADTEPNLEKAQVSVGPYLDAGKKILMTTSFQEFASNQGDPLEFSPADSLGAKITRITRNQVVSPAASYAERGFPELRVSAAIVPNVFPLVPKISSEIMYVLPENPSAWPGTPAMAVVDGASSFVFFGLPIAALNGNNTAAELIEKILNEVF